MPSSHHDLRQLCTAIGRELSKHRSALAQESELSRVVGVALDALGIKYLREVRLGPGERLDFLLEESGVAIELKKKRAGVEAFRQVGRYLAHESVRGCIIIAPQVEKLAEALNDKPIMALPLWKYLVA